jgi:hypothetical protein
MFDLPLLRQQDILEDYRRRQHHRRRERMAAVQWLFPFGFAVTAAHSWAKKQNPAKNSKTCEIDWSY